MVQISKRKKRPLRFYEKTKVRPGEPINVRYQAYSKSACTYAIVNQGHQDVSGFDGNYEYLRYKIHSKKPYTTVLPCIHVKNEVTWFPLSTNTLTSNTKKLCSGSYVPSSIWWYEYPTGTFIPFADGYRLPTIPDCSIAHREAINFFASGCQSLTANFAVNITEIGDLVKLAKHAFDAFGVIRKVYRNGRFPFSWKTFVKKLTRGDSLIAWDATGLAASAHLAWNFAIAPLISDIKKMANELKSLDERIGWFVNNSNTPTPVRFTKDLTPLVPLQSITYPTTSGSYALNAITSYECTYKAFALATYDVSTLTKSQVRYKLLKKALGFSNPLTFLYEKIPFSFVIDWIINVGEYIATFDTEIMFPYVLAMCGHSITINESRTYAAQNIVSGYTPTYTYKGIYAVDNIQYYERHPGIPITYSGLNVSPPTLKQLSLALALGRSFFRK